MDIVNVSRLNSGYAKVSVPAPSLPSAQEDSKIQDSVSLGSKDNIEDDATKLAKRAAGRNGSPEDVTVLRGTDGNDKILISQGEYGSLKVTINEDEHKFSKEEAAKLVIDGGEGNDTIKADKTVTANLFITGGAGNDKIIGGAGNDYIIDNYGQNYISAGKGNDYIIANGLDLQGEKGNILKGGTGNDYIEGSSKNDFISGGAGNDVIYGMAGDDVISAGQGRDYVDGGHGQDIISAKGSGNMLFGGQGNDQIKAQGQNNLIIDAYGENTINVEGEARKVITSEGSQITAPQGTVIEHAQPVEIPSNFQPTGEKTFQERVQNDLESLAQLDIGQKMFESIAETGKTVSYKETENGNKCSFGTDGYLDSDDHDVKGPGSSSTVYYNRSTIALKSNHPWSERPPLVGMYHEMVHSYNAATGTLDGWYYDYNGGPAFDMYGVSGAEFQAVGIDHPMIQANPEGLSENSLRNLLGLEKRERY